MGRCCGFRGWSGAAWRWLARSRKKYCIYAQIPLQGAESFHCLGFNARATFVLGMNQVSRNIALWLVVVLMGLLLVNFFSRTQQRPPEIIFSDFLNDVDRGHVSEVI